MNQSTKKEGSQTYEEYCAMRRAYNFIPVSRETWQNWQTHYHGGWKKSKSSSLEP